MSSGSYPQRTSSTYTLTRDSLYPVPSSFGESITTLITNAGPLLISAHHAIPVPDESVCDNNPSSALDAGNSGLAATVKVGLISSALIIELVS